MDALLTDFYTLHVENWVLNFLTQQGKIHTHCPYADYM